MIATVIGTLALVIFVFLAVRYMYKERKKGNKCVGCPYAGSCQKHSSEHSCGSGGLG